MTLASLCITDGTTTINLISDKNGFYLQDWTPTTAPAKNDGIWQDSPFVDGRQLAMKQYGNIIDTMTVGISASSPDDLIYFSQELRRMLRKASQYWTTNWQNEPVWIEAKADCETNLRYAIIMDGRLGEDDNPYAEPMVGTGTQYAMPDLSLVLEHQYWTAQEPMTADCLYVRNHNRYPWVMWVAPIANILPLYTTSATLDDLPAANLTAEIWVYGDLLFGAGTGYLFWKSGWYVKVDAARTISCFAQYGGANATLTTATALPVNPQGWTHIAAVLDFAARTWAVYINGVAAGGAPAAGAGAYVGDAVTDLYIGSTSAAATNLFDTTTRYTTESRLTWTRLSNSIRYAAPFTPTAYDVLPGYDANTICTTNGCQTWAGGNIAWANSFAPYYVDDLSRGAYVQGNFFLGVERYLENTSSFFCEDLKVASANCDREGAGIDYAFWYDVSLGTYGPNVIDNWPSNLFPTAAIVANDEFYIGIGATQGAMPVQSFVMEVTNPMSWVTNTPNITFWNGAWVAVTNFEITRYQTSNVLIFSSEVDAGWVPTTINGYYAYWLKIAWNPVAGVQNQIAAGPALISSPAVEVANTGTSIINGDLGAIIRFLAHNLNDNAANLYPTISLLSSYSPDQRNDSPVWFTPYINLCSSTAFPGTKPRNQPGIEITTGGTGVASTVQSIYAPGGLTTQFAMNAGQANYFLIYLRPWTAWNFKGKFRVFGRMIDVSGGAVRADCVVSLELTDPYRKQLGTDLAVPVNSELIEFGLLDLTAVGQGQYLGVIFKLTVENNSIAARTVQMLDLILFPVDEWVGDYDTPGEVISADYFDSLYINPVSAPKHNRNAIYFRNLLGASTLVSVPLSPYATWINATGAVASMSGKYPVLQANAIQKVFALQGTYSAAYDQYNTHFDRTWTAEKIERYESMRGSR